MVLIIGLLDDRGINPEDISTTLIHRFVDNISSPYDLSAYQSKDLPYRFCDQQPSPSEFGFSAKPLTDYFFLLLLLWKKITNFA